MKSHHLSEIDGAKDIDIVQKKGLLGSGGVPMRPVEKERRRLLQAAASVEQYILARDFDAHAEVVVRLQILQHELGEVMDVDDHLADAKCTQATQRNLEQRVA